MSGYVSVLSSGHIAVPLLPLTLLFTLVTSSVMVTQASSSDRTPEGETLSLICEAQSFPTPDVTWLHNGNPVFPSSRPRHTVVTVEVEEYLLRSVLNISDVVPGDAGEYRCRLDNLNEPVDYSIMVSIEGETISSLLHYATSFPREPGNEATNLYCTMQPHSQESLGTRLLISTALCNLIPKRAWE